MMQLLPQRNVVAVTLRFAVRLGDIAMIALWRLADFEKIPREHVFTRSRPYFVSL
jgi:hypothetical protein